MKNVRSSLSRFGRVVWLSGIAAVCVVGLVACGGDGGQATPPPVVMAENADVNKTIQSDAWEVTLLDPPHKDEIVGDESDEGIQLQTEYQTVLQEAEGIWVIVPIQLMNSGDDANMLTGTTLQIQDGQGRQYRIADRLVHNAEVTVANPERWGNLQENQLVQNVFDVGVSRKGPAIFDVADDATGLVLVLKGSDETIDLGF